MVRRSLLFVVLALLLAGCGGTPIPTAVPPTATPVPVLGSTQARPADGMVMVYVPAGEFTMGSTDTQVDEVLDLCNEYIGDCQREWFTGAQPTHPVSLDAFWLDRTEVTNAQFAAFLNASGNQEEGGVTWLEIKNKNALIEEAAGTFRPKDGYADHPAIEVSWYAAAAYCAWAGGRLPTEAEWEYAARGPASSVYPWGDSFDSARLNYCDKQCYFSWKDDDGDDGYERTAPVGSYPAGASWCGALDMAGSVWEWVSDRYGEDYYAQSPSANPPGPADGEKRAVRGGSWFDYPGSVRSAGRGQGPPEGRNDTGGFRCAAPGQP